MKKYRYDKIVHQEYYQQEDSVEMINRFGKEGWEVISYNSYKESRGYLVEVFLIKQEV